MKKPDKDNYTISNPISGPSHFPVSRVKSAHTKIYKEQLTFSLKATFLMEKMSMYIKSLNASQVLLPLIEQMSSNYKW